MYGRCHACVLVGLGVLVLGFNAAMAADEPAKPKIDPKHPLVKPLQIAYDARDAVDKIKDYEATFIKKERIKGKLITQKMQLKFRDDPYSVYLKFIDPDEGQEVLFVKGRNKDNLIVRPVGLAGIVGPLELPPTGQMAMEDNKYPVTMVGIKIMISQLIKQWEAEGQFGEIDVQFYENATLNNGKIACEVVETSHPKKRNQFPYQMTRLFIEKSSGLPIRVEQYDFPAAKEKEAPLAEEYTYLNLKTNLGFKESDFDRNNPKYNLK